jgi:hypothetical protein
LSLIIGFSAYRGGLACSLAEFSITLGAFGQTRNIWFPKLAADPGEQSAISAFLNVLAIAGC